jgi:hypothetical protein
MYTLTLGTTIIRDADGAQIPPDPRNGDYAAYLAWLAAGNTPTPCGLAAVQSAQSQIITAACQQAITSGFQSSALGSAYTYPSQMTDQQNLAANVLSSVLPGLPGNWTTLQMCASASGVWGYLPHTAAQIQQVGIDGKAAILACLTKNATLQAQIAAAATPAAVMAITW